MAAPKRTDKPKSIEFYGVEEVYSASGVDLTLLRENLRLSLEKRWANNRLAVVFARLLMKRLAANRIQYALVGSQAMYAHGLAHLTEDFEICYQRTPANLSALVAALAPTRLSLRGAPPGLPFHFDVPTLTAGVNFLLVTSYGYLNLLGEVSGAGNYDQVLAQSVERTVFGLTVRILSVDGLIAAKKAAGRNKDHSHLLELIELKKNLEAAKPAQGQSEPPAPA